MSAFLCLGLNSALPAGFAAASSSASPSPLARAPAVDGLLASATLLMGSERSLHTGGPVRFTRWVPCNKIKVEDLHIARLAILHKAKSA